MTSHQAAELIRIRFRAILDLFDDDDIIAALRLLDEGSRATLEAHLRAARRLPLAGLGWEATGQVPPAQDAAWREMVALGEELQGGPATPDGMIAAAEIAAGQETARIIASPGHPGFDLTGLPLGDDDSGPAADAAEQRAAFHPGLGIMLGVDVADVCDLKRGGREEGCPDGGTCHHECTRGCWRVKHAGPLGISGWETWPPGIVEQYGDSDGIL